jgi:hypothetical protein
MPTPIGHALAGLSTAWFSSNRPSKLLLAACAGAAVAADLDILTNSHRSYTHSVGAVVVVGAIAWVIARLRSRPTAVKLALTIAAAYGTHILLDWLGSDPTPPRGVQALWPFSSRYYISGADLFMGVSRRYWNPQEFIVGNLKAGAWELLVLAPIAALAWYSARRRQGRGARGEG